MFVEAVVGQMHVLVLQIAGVIHVALGGKPHQPLVEHVDPQRVETRHQHVQPQVKLVPIDEHWISDVPLHDPSCPRLGLFSVVLLCLGAQTVARNQIGCLARVGMKARATQRTVCLSIPGGMGLLGFWRMLKYARFTHPSPFSMHKIGATTAMRWKSHATSCCAAERIHSCATNEM